MTLKYWITQDMSWYERRYLRISVKLNTVSEY